jgi:hypothetical protein
VRALVRQGRGVATRKRGNIRHCDIGRPPRRFCSPSARLLNASRLRRHANPEVKFQLNWTRVMKIAAPVNSHLNQSYDTGAHPNLTEMRAKLCF